MTGRKDKSLEAELKGLAKFAAKNGPSQELTTRLKYSIIEVDGEKDKAIISNFVDNMLSRDSLHLRQEINRVAPNIELEQEIDIEGDSVTVDIPMTANFFWPEA